MDAVLLCAGRGTRLRPLTDVLPKPVLPVLDVPLGAWPLAGLLRADLGVLVNLSHLGSLVPPALRPFGPFETLVEEPQAYGSGGTIAAVRADARCPLVTSNGDVLSDLDPEELLQAHRRSGADATVAVIDVEAGGDFELSGGRATSFIDRRDRPQVPGGRFTGMAVFEQPALALLPDRRPLGLAEHLLKALADSGRLAAHRHGGYYLDVGTFDGYLQASADVLAGRAPAAPRGLPGDLVGPDGGRAYLGPGARAAGESLGPGAVVLAGARLEPAARVERAVVWPHEVVPAGTELADCVWAFGECHPKTLDK
jgi:mannose-1-phosphate guanylyltransferase